jgi:hypothetical protein
VALSIRNSASLTITCIVRIETEAIKVRTRQRAGQTSDANGEVIFAEPLIAIYFDGLDRLESIYSIACSRFATSRQRKAVSR